MSTYLPQEIVEKILCKLPIKSCFRFSTVSKEWRNLITPIPNTPTNKTIFLIACSSSRNEFAFLLDNDGISEGYVSVKVEDDDEEEEEEKKKKGFNYCFGLRVDCASLWQTSYSLEPIYSSSIDPSQNLGRIGMLIVLLLEF
ncbi:hypothetical protein LIER_28103 [Lithospermum erythrorhizon]|uniref:F-box domain-containing protein n=1 Tax=Lithospermum erythrorhizon TaxID=34254 RepID=A0AAV3RHE3_LITER